MPKMKIKSRPPPADYTSSCRNTSLISMSSCVIFLLTTVIGNFGVSDADVVLRQHHSGDPIHNQRGNLNTRSINRDHDLNSGVRDGGGGDELLLNSFPLTSSSGGSNIVGTTIKPGESQKNQLSHQQEAYFHLSQTASSSNNKNKPTQTPPFTRSDEDGTLEDQMYLRLLTTITNSHRQSSTPSSYLHKRGVREVNDLKFLEESIDGGNRAGVDLGYPLPLSMDDYLALDRDRLLDQLVIRALANPGEWTELRQAFEKVDGDLKALLSLVKKRKNQAISDGTTNSSLEHPLSLGMEGSKSGAGTSINTAPSSSPSTQQHSQQEENQHDHHGLKWKFTYHRVHDLNAAGQPTSRGIAAVVSLDSVAAAAVSATAVPKIKAETVKLEPKESNSTTSLKLSNENKTIVSPSSLSSSLPHLDGPIHPDRGERVEQSSSNSNNIISDSLTTSSRFGNKEKHVDLARSDKNSRKTDGDDSVSSSVRNGMIMPLSQSALVLPMENEEALSQGNALNSHKIQWDSRRHGQGGGGGDVKELQSYSAAVKEAKSKAAAVENDDGSQHHHPARHHHHYHKNYYHDSTHTHHHQHRQQHLPPRQMSFSSTTGEAIASVEGDYADVFKDFHLDNEARSDDADSDDALFIPQNNNNHHHRGHSHHQNDEQNEWLSPLPSQYQSHQHHTQNKNNHFHMSHGDDTVVPHDGRDDQQVAETKNYLHQHSSSHRGNNFHHHQKLNQKVPHQHHHQFHQNQ